MLGAALRTNPADISVTPSRSQFVRIRGLSYHVRTWGTEGAPKLFLLHGWMDVSASFQFLVDALATERHVLAPDWRGFGLTEAPQDGYWFPDYVADLDALVHELAPGEKVDVAGHSLGGNVAMIWAGARSGKAAHVVSLDALGVPGDPPSQAPAKLRAWLDALNDPPAFAPYAGMAAVAARLRKNNPRLSQEKAAFLAQHWAETLRDGSARLRADPRHKLPFPTVSRLDDVYAIWQAIDCPVLWVVAEDSYIPRWVAPGADARAEIERRFAHVPNGTLHFVADAGHMLHHDQPDVVARLIESFLGQNPR